MRLCGALFCIVFLLAAVSYADEELMSPTAKEHFERGNSFYYAKEFEQAKREYRAAYEAQPRPEFLWAIGQAERVSGRCESAIEAYQRFLATAPNAERSVLAGEHIAYCKKQLEDEARKQQARSNVSKPRY